MSLGHGRLRFSQRRSYRDTFLFARRFRGSGIALSSAVVQTPSTIPRDASPASAPGPHADSLAPKFACAVFLGLLWFVLCRHLSGEWRINEQYNYGWFVPFFAAYLLWLRWEDRPMAMRDSEFGKPSAMTADRSSPLRPSAPRIKNRKSKTENWIAAAITIGALLLLLPLRLFEIGNPDWRPLGWLHASLVVAVTSVAIWRAGGRVWLRHFAFPVAFIFVAVPWISPIEEPVVQGLMRAVAAGAAEMLSLFGIPAQLEGSLIRVNTGLVGVNEACSGVRSLQTSLMIGLLFGELKRFSTSRRFLLLSGCAGRGARREFHARLFPRLGGRQGRCAGG